MSFWKKILFALFVALISILIRYFNIQPWTSKNYHKSIIKELKDNEVKLNVNSENAVKCLSANDKLFSKEELSQFDRLPNIFLAFLGIVYNVSTGYQHYESGATYEVFAGKDATRAFFTGNFTELIDDITDLDDSFLDGIDTWINFYQEKYQRIGLLIGSYYDQNGCPTDKLRILEMKISRLMDKKSMESDELKLYPPCNSQWEANKKQGRVWCTKLSGGITRDWIGRPRLFYELATKKWRCACTQTDDELDFCDEKYQRKNTDQIGMKYDDVQDLNCRFKYYPDCDKNSFECIIRD